MPQSRSCRPGVAIETHKYAVNRRPRKKVYPGSRRNTTWELRLSIKMRACRWRLSSYFVHKYFRMRVMPSTRRTPQQQHIVLESQCHSVSGTTVKTRARSKHAGHLKKDQNGRKHPIIGVAGTFAGIQLDTRRKWGFLPMVTI
jgi:hypothetical protein